MRFRDRPLLVDGLDADLYLERPKLEQSVLLPLLEGRNVLLLGDAGSGKSTLLRRTAAVLEQRGHSTVLVNAAPAADTEDLLEIIDVALEQRIGVTGRPEHSDGLGSSARVLAGVRRMGRNESVAVMVDGLIDPDIGYHLFGRLRDELWELGHVWAVAVRPRDSAALRTPPADAFWGSVVEISPLDYEQTEHLLRLGLDAAEYQQVDRDRGIAGEHPRALIRAAQAMLAGQGEPGTASLAQDLVERASQLGRGEAMAMVELQGLGRPASAHDAELLGRLGWSRPYAQRMLSHLEENGLVRSIPERSDRPGRPRKLYEPNPHSEAR